MSRDLIIDMQISVNVSKDYYAKLTNMSDEEIASHIAEMQSLTDDTVSSIEAIQSVINESNDSTMQISNAVVAQAEADAPKSGYDISHYYTVSTNDDGSVALQTADDTDIEASNIDRTTDEVTSRPEREGYTGYLVGTGDAAPNGAPFGFGIGFPTNNEEGDYFLRTDFLPNRMFRYDGTRWVKVQDDIRMSLSNTLERQTYKTTFINNNKTSQIDGETVQERQSLSKALRPKADN